MFLNANTVTNLKAIVLHPHQKAVAAAVEKFLQNPQHSPSGQLVFFEVGTGKTLAALHAAKTFVDLHNTNGHVYIISTLANLENTWARDWTTYKRCIVGDSSVYKRHIHWGTKGEILEKTVLKEPYMLVVDEAHLLRNDESQGGIALMEACTRATYKILLTATPLVRTLQDLATLHGYLTCKPTKFDESMTSRSIVNCFKKMVLFQAQDHSRFPTVNHTEQTVQVGSEYDAFFQRDEAKLKALREQLANKRIGSETWQKTIARVCSKGLNPRAVNPFHVNGRQVCNMPKFPAIFQSICASSETRIVVYSNFRDSGVVGFFDWICSEQNFRKTSKHAFHSCVKTLDGGRKMEVALWDNDLCKELSKWQKQDSDGLKVLLLSPMAREGVSLKGVRVFHLMEPSWNATDEEQAIGRASRLTSHTHLSPDQRNVTVTKWTALYKPGKRTSDERVASLGAEKEKFLDPVRKKLKIVGEQAVKSLSA